MTLFQSIPTITFDTTIGDLPTIRRTFTPDTEVGLVLEALEERSDLEGVLVVDPDGDVGAASRSRFLGVLSRTFAREVFLRKSVGHFLRSQGLLPLTMDGDTPLRVAVQRALGRDRDGHVEPIVVRNEAGPPELLTMDVLLRAAARQSDLVRERARALHESLREAGRREAEHLAGLGRELARPAERIAEVAERLRRGGPSPDDLTDLESAAQRLRDLIRTAALVGPEAPEAATGTVNLWRLLDHVVARAARDVPPEVLVLLALDPRVPLEVEAPEELLTGTMNRILESATRKVREGEVILRVTPGLRSTVNFVAETRPGRTSSSEADLALVRHLLGSLRSELQQVKDRCGDRLRFALPLVARRTADLPDLSGLGVAVEAAPDPVRAYLTRTLRLLGATLRDPGDGHAGEGAVTTFRFARRDDPGPDSPATILREPVSAIRLLELARAVRT